MGKKVKRSKLIEDALNEGRDCNDAVRLYLMDYPDAEIDNDYSSKESIH